MAYNPGGQYEAPRRAYMQESVGYDGNQHSGRPDATGFPKNDYYDDSRNYTPPIANHRGGGQMQPQQYGRSGPPNEYQQPQQQQSYNPGPGGPNQRSRQPLANQPPPPP